MTNKDLLLTKISRIKNLIRNKSSHDVYFENGTKYLRNIIDFKINSMAFDNFKWMIGQGSLDYLSINKIEVINDNQNLLLKNISRVYAYLNDELNTYQETFYDAFNKKIKETNDHGLTKEYLYDSNDNLIFDDNEDWIALEKISPHLINATVYTEDKNYQIYLKKSLDF